MYLNYELNRKSRILKMFMKTITMMICFTHNIKNITEMTKTINIYIYILNKITYYLNTCSRIIIYALSIII